MNRTFSVMALGYLCALLAVIWLAKLLIDQTISTLISMLMMFLLGITNFLS